MLLITTEQLNPVYLAADKIETRIMSKKKFTSAEEIDIRCSLCLVQFKRR